MIESPFSVGDRVKMSPMWKRKTAIGNVVKITVHYVIVEWDDVNGQWHYTHEQSKKLECAS